MQLEVTNLKRKLIAGLISIGGIYWIWSCFYPPTRRAVTEGDLLGNAWFLLSVVPLMSLPGFLAIYWGIRLFQSYSHQAIKSLVGTFLVFTVLFLAGRLSYYFPEQLVENGFSFLPVFVFSCGAVPVYCLTSRRLIQYISGENLSTPDLLNKGVFILLAWLLWITLFSIFEELGPVKEGYSHVKEDPWQFTGFIVPIIVAYVFYKIAILKLEKL